LPRREHVKQSVVVELRINGDRYELAVKPQATLLEVLREELGLTGTKEGCGTGECGSCTVLLDGAPVLSCLTLAVDCDGRTIVTIEGLAPEGRLTAVQQAYLDAGAVQCGFCTPGMVLSTTALLRENPRPAPADIEKALEGNLCRCTGYNKIVEAVHRAAAALASGQE
jgi:aerobic-type carbon monoxide dehydrogenase small subunit (CoxS/CutS family)